MSSTLVGPCLALWVVNAIGWVVLLAGVATTTSAYSTDYELGLWWWSVWFQFVVLILVAITASTATSAGWVQIRRDFLVMVSVVLMVTAHGAQVEMRRAQSSGVPVTEIDSAAPPSPPPAPRNTTHTGAQTTLGGAIICIIMNIALLLYFALEVGSSEWKIGPSIYRTKAAAAAAASGGIEANGARGSHNGSTAAGTPAAPAYYSRQDGISPQYPMQTA